MRLVRIARDLKGAMLLEQKVSVVIVQCHVCVLLPQTAMGHNKDGTPIDLSTGYLVKAQVMEESGSVENFFAYCYAGQLCGNAFGYNGKGVVTTVNSLFPRNLNTSAIGKCSQLA